VLRVTAKFCLVTAAGSARRVARSIAVPAHHGSTFIEPIVEHILKLDALVSAAVALRAAAVPASAAFPHGGQSR